jgi:hypothetical protein
VINCDDAMNVPGTLLTLLLHISQLVRPMCGKFRQRLRENSLLTIDRPGKSAVFETLIENVARARTLQSAMVLRRKQ